MKQQIKEEAQIELKSKITDIIAQYLTIHGDEGFKHSYTDAYILNGNNMMMKVELNITEVKD